MSTKRDYYEVLEVGRNASPDELRRAYRRLAKQHHPDINKDHGSEERFKEINEAYAVLSDAERRASYDRFGHAGVQAPTDLPGFADIWEFWFRRWRAAQPRALPRRRLALGLTLSSPRPPAVRTSSSPGKVARPARARRRRVRHHLLRRLWRRARSARRARPSWVRWSTLPPARPAAAGETTHALVGPAAPGSHAHTVQRAVLILAGVDEGIQVRLAGRRAWATAPHGNRTRRLSGPIVSSVQRDVRSTSASTSRR
jgi:hypothetical protein